MSEDAEQVERVAQAIALADGEDYMEDHARFDRYARAAIAAMQSEGVPIYRHPDATDEFVKPSREGHPRAGDEGG